MNVTKDRFNNRQLHIEDYLQMLSAEQKEHAEVLDYQRITENNHIIADFWMEKRGSRYLRYALFNATIYVCIWDPTFKAYLAKKRAEGKHYYVAISHACKKLIRVIYRMQLTGEPYRAS